MTRPVQDQQRSFSKGEIHKLLSERDDLALWQTAVRRLDGFIILPEGGATRTPGTYLVDATLDPDAPPELLEFEFSDDFTQSYVLLLGTEILTVYTADGQVVDGAEDPVEVVTPWSVDVARTLDYAQSNDIVFITSGLAKVKKLERRAHDDWQLVDYVNEDGPYQPRNLDQTLTITPSATTGTITLTASEDLFVAGDVGLHVRIFNNSKWGWCEITTVTNATTVTATVKRTLGNTDATWEWRLGSWGDARGWPSTCCFFEDRLAFGRSIYADLSVSGEFYNHAPSTPDNDGNVTNDVIATDAFTAAIHADKASKINFLVEDVALIVGTASAIRVITNGTNEDPGLSPDNAMQKRQSGFGARPVRPVQPDDGVTFYAHKHGQRLLELGYSLEQDRLTAADLSKFARHMLKGKIRKMAWQSQPFGVLWVLLETGELVSFTYDRNEEILAWGHQPLGGTDATVCSIAVIPGEKQDTLWLVTKRTIDGQSKCFLERQADLYDPSSPTDYDGCFFVQAGIEYTGAATNTITGLGALEGETVGIFADGYVLTDQVVTDGQITVDRQVTKAYIGLDYLTRMQTLGLPSRAVNDTAATKRSTRLIGASVSVVDTLGVFIGVSDGPLTRKATRPVTVPAGAPDPLQDEVITLPTKDSFSANKRGSVEIQQIGPRPLTIRSLIPVYDTQATGTGG